MCGDIFVVTADSERFYWYGVDRDRGCAKHPVVQGTAPTNRDLAPNINSVEGGQSSSGRDAFQAPQLRKVSSCNCTCALQGPCLSATLASTARPSGWHLPPPSGSRKGPAHLRAKCTAYPGLFPGTSRAAISSPHPSWPIPSGLQTGQVSSLPLNGPQAVWGEPVPNPLLSARGRTLACLVPPPGPLGSSACWGACPPTRPLDRKETQYQFRTGSMCVFGGRK